MRSLRHGRHLLVDNLGRLDRKQLRIRANLQALALDELKRIHVRNRLEINHRLQILEHVLLELNNDVRAAGHHRALAALAGNQRRRFLQRLGSPVVKLG